MMQELTRVTLENEMDLILAHKRSMKLAELAGLSLPAQTTFATAISEVSRNIIDGGKSGYLVLSIDIEQKEKYIIASLKDKVSANINQWEGLEYAKKLVDKYNVTTRGAETSVELFYFVAPSFKIDVQKIDEWRQLFRNDKPISPYEELKRKNEQLQTLSQKIQKSEEQYKTLTNSLPLTIFSLDLQGQLIYANEWLLKYTGETLESLNTSKWKNIVHADDYDSFSVLLNTEILKGTTGIKTQSRLKNKYDNNYLWHQVSLSPLRDEKNDSLYWIGYIVDIHAQKSLEETLKDNIELKQTQLQLKEHQHMLENYISELNRSNLELQQFAFVASHDLQEPVRKILFYSDYLLRQYNDSIDKKSKEVLQHMQDASHRMRSLIQDLLVFSQINKEGITLNEVDLNKIANATQHDLEMLLEDKKAILHIESLPTIHGDERMLRQLFENIINNAIKYAKADVAPEIKITYKKSDNNVEIAFKDNGIGFDEKYQTQIFTLFQRLHGREKYNGTGLGLAICKKIVDLHNGKIWAESKEGEGATFFISIPQKATIF